MSAIHTEPHLHLGGCVKDRCASTCPRRGRPTGPDGRCACVTCTVSLVGDWGTDDVEQAVIGAAPRYREMTAGGAA